jgi:hypothetical protein
MPESEMEVEGLDRDEVDLTVPNAYQITLGSTAHEYITAGNSCFTLVSRRSGNRYSYRVKRAKNMKADNAPLFVYVLNGRNNIRSYEHIGTIFTRDTPRPEIRQGVKGIFDRYFQPRRTMVMESCVRAFAYAFEKIRWCALPKECDLWYAGRCGRCNKVITNPASILTGFGPECFQHTIKGQLRSTPAVRM